MRVFRTGLVAACATLLAGCPEVEQGLVASSVLVPGPKCVFAASVGGAKTYIARGRVDLAVNRRGYIAGINLTNGLPSSMSVSKLSETEGRLEANTLLIRGATVRYEAQGLDDIELPSGFFQYSPSSAIPGGASAGIVNLLPPPVMDVLKTADWLVEDKEIGDPLLRECYKLTHADAPLWRDVPQGGREVEILVRIQFEADTLEGTTVYSNELLYPITVCVGCLIPAADSCTVLADVSAAGLDNLVAPTCAVGQDEAIDTRRCFAQLFYVEGAELDWLIQCATDEAFPPEAVQHFQCRCAEDQGVGCYGTYPDGLSVAEQLQHRVQHLAFRMALERVNAYCTGLPAESPLWAPQNP